MTVIVRPYQVSFEEIYGCTPDEAKIPDGWELNGEIIKCNNGKEMILSDKFQAFAQTYLSGYRAVLVRKQLTFQDLQPGPFIAKWREDNGLYMKLDRKTPEGYDAVGQEGMLRTISPDAIVEKY